MNGTGIVIETDGVMAKIRINASGECVGCPSKSHCHGDERKPREIAAVNGCGAGVSDAVFFEAETWKMIVSSLLIWIMPVLAMLLGYVVAERFAKGIFPVLAAFLFLGLSFVVLRFVDRAITGGKTFYPTITRVLSRSEYAELTVTECNNQ